MSVQEAVKICMMYVVKYMNKSYKLPKRTDNPFFKVAISMNWMCPWYWDQMRCLIKVFIKRNEIDD